MMLKFGVMAPPLKKQLGTKQSCDVFQRSADAISRLHVHGLLTDSESERARRRLIAKIRRKFGKK